MPDKLRSTLKGNGYKVPNGFGWGRSNEIYYEDLWILKAKGYGALVVLTYFSTLTGWRLTYLLC